MSKYQIRYGSNIIGDLSDADYAYYNGVLEMAKNEAGKLSFSLSSQNPSRFVQPLKPVTLWRDGCPIWAGRVVSTTDDIYNSRHIVCEGALSWTNDIIYKPPVSLSLVTAGAAITALIEKYNSECTYERQINLGEIADGETVTISETSNYLTIFELLSQIIELGGGFYTMSVGTDGTPSLNYYTIGEKASQEIRYGVNLLDIDKLIDATKIVTKLYAVGDGITVDVQNDSAIEKYGIVTAYKQFSGITSTSSLKTAAQKWIDENSLGESTLTISAYDLSITDPMELAFGIGNTVHLVSEPHGIDTILEVSEMRININNPASSQITLGKTHEKLTKTVAKEARKWIIRS